MATEAFRKEVSRQLTELQDGTGPETIEYPATLSSEERKYIHGICLQFKLKSKSKGSGANRYLTVARKAGAAAGPLKVPGFGASLSTAAAPFVASEGSPLKLPEWLFEDPQISNMPACPSRWSFSSPADLRRLQAGGKGGKQKSPVRAEAPTRKALDASEASRLSAKPAYATMQAGRRKLPSWSYVDRILEASSKSRVVLVAGETGCGKSTQVPQFILDASPSSRMMVTQPRRIAAVSLAQRVAQERCEEVGGSIGYSIHLDTKSSASTRCTYCTTGVFRRRLLNDPLLAGMTHIMIDEVHERELHGDFVLIVLKQLMERNKDLRLILMSATLQLEIFQNFFPGSATVQIPGRMFPVKRLYLEDAITLLHKNQRFRSFLGPGFAAAGHVKDEKDFKRQVATQEGHWDQVCGYGKHLNEPMTPARLADGCYYHDVLQQGRGMVFDIAILDALILHFDEEHLRKQKANPSLQPGAILIFFPGWGDIDAAKRRLRDSLDNRRFLVLPCHSQVRPEQQREIFKRPPAGVQKIILASNIAETSITIEDVSIVIDTGRAKEASYDPYLKVGTLATVFVSKASAQQRAGRAGRTKEGICYHLFCRDRHEKMEDFRAPELLRSPLEDVCLHTAHLLAQQRAALGNGGKADGKSSGPSGIAAWLAKAPQPPEAVAVRNAVELLKVLGALTPKGDLSGLGAQLANLPLPATIARSVVWGALLGCLDSVLVIVGASTGRDPFQLPQDRKGGKGGDKMGGRGSSFGQLSGILRKIKCDLAAPYQSDHIALLRAVEAFEAAKSKGDAEIRRICDRWSLNRNAVQGVIDVRDRMKKELKHQRLLADELVEFANRNESDPSILLAVVAAGVFPNLAVKRAQKKKIEVNGGRVDAGTHPSSVLNLQSGGGKDKGGKGGKNSKGAGGPAEWLCYTEMMQVEERYSMTGVSWVSPVTLLLLCGDEPVEIQGSGKDVSVSLLDGWAEFVMPRAQVMKLQNLRYALRQAFSSYCETPQRVPGEWSELLDSVVSVLQGSMDEAGRAIACEGGYSPRVAAYVSAAGVGAGKEDYAVLTSAAKAGSAHAKGGLASKIPAFSAVTQAVPVVAKKAETSLKEGMEVQGVTDLLREIYGPPENGQRPIEWSFESLGGGSIQATLTVPQDSSTFEGPPGQGQQIAKRLAAKVAWEALKSLQDEVAAEEVGEAEPPADADEVEAEEEPLEEATDDVPLDEQEDPLDEAPEDVPLDEEPAEEEVEPVANDAEMEAAGEVAQEEAEEEVEAVVEGDDEVAEEISEQAWYAEAAEGPEDAGEADGGDEVDLLDEVGDPAMLAALRFMQGDVDYKDSSMDLDGALLPDEEPAASTIPAASLKRTGAGPTPPSGNPPSWKRQRQW